MKYELITITKLFVATILPVIFAIALYLLDKKTAFGEIKKWKKQIIIGILFGALAIFATEFGINIDGAIINVRNAAPLTAALIFGGPAGIISGIIGGLYRFFATYWGAGSFSQIACTIGCILAGILGAGCRKLMFDNKKTSWPYGLAIGATIETLHMLLIFITNMDDVYNAYRIVKSCALPMIICNSLSVMLSLFFIALIGKERIKITFKNKQILNVFQLVLLACVIVAFTATMLFTYSLQTEIANADTENLLMLNLQDLDNDVKQATDDNLLRKTRQIATIVDMTTPIERLEQLLIEYNIAEINIIDENGIVVNSTTKDYLNYDMASGEQSREFLCLLSTEKEYVQKYQPLSFNKEISRKYAGIAFENGGFVQVGYNADQFQADISDEIIMAVKNRHIGQKGGLIVCDSNFEIVGDTNNQNNNNKKVDILNVSENVKFKTTINDIQSYCMYNRTEGFYLLATIPVSEAMFSRDIAVCILTFMEIIVFATLFVTIYFLIKKLIVNNIHRINDSLALITSGNLNVQVNVRDTDEFISLSDDINATVDALKHFIDEAEKRIDRELEFARQIQRSSLPLNFDSISNQKGFDIYALMDPAKEVGGDFYDFYLLNQTHLIFMVADVSGKGIPAALFMMRTKTLIKGLVEGNRSLDEVFTEANKGLCENNDAEMFVTAWIGKLDLNSGKLEFVNAGHNPPLIRRSNGQFEYLRTRPNFILAGMDSTKYQKHEIELLDGDAIFLYTDGVTEATTTSNSIYGEKRLNQILSSSNGSAKEICDNVKNDIKVFVNDAEQSDDITMLCIVKHEKDSSEEILLKPNHESLILANEFVMNVATKLHLSKKLVNKIQMANDEIYSNIVYYSGASSASIKIVDNLKTLKMIFMDDGKVFNPLANPEPDINISYEERKIGGLGIYMVKKFATSINYENINGQNLLTVTFNKEQEDNRN